MSSLALGSDAIVEEHAFSWRAHLPQLRDPGHASLRRAVRAALLAPALFAVCSILLPLPQLVTFATFGVFALLVMGDFGGLSRPRAAAYALTTAVGCLLICLGSLASANPWVAVIVVFGGGFALQFAGLFGGYVTAAQLPLLLSLVLSVAIPATPDLLPQRLAGWVLGGALALVGGVFLWPRHEQMTLHQAAGAACQALGDLVAARYASRPDWAAVDRQRQRAQAAIGALRQVYLVTPRRPASPTRQDRAFAELVDELGRELKFVSAFSSPDQPVEIAAPEAARRLAETVTRTLQASASVLTGARPAPDLASLLQQRDEQHQAMGDWAAEALRAGTPSSTVLDRLEAIRSLRVVSYVALAIGASATLATGRGLDVELIGMPLEIETAAGPRAGLQRALDSLQTHLRLSSIWCRNSLRAAMGLALAVLLVDLLGLDHAFWAVLGTLSVLRTNALATGRTALAAIAGTTLGILPASLLLIPLGTDPRVLWTAFPVTVFLAAYAPSVIGFVVGQAAFTLLIMVLFNLIQPVGWTLGLVRLEDVAIGAALSLVVGALFWPRGARGQLRTALGSLYRHDAAYLRAAFQFTLGQLSAEACLAAREVATREAARAGEVFDQFLLDRAAKVLPPATWAALQAGGSHLLLAGDALEQMAGHGYQVTACGAATGALARGAEAVVDELDRLGTSLEHGQAPASSPGSSVSETDLWQAAADCLSAWGGADDSTRRGSALGMVAACDWIHYLGLLTNHLSGPAAAVVRVAKLPWSH